MNPFSHSFLTSVRISFILSSQIKNSMFNSSTRPTFRLVSSFMMNTIKETVGSFRRRSTVCKEGPRRCKSAECPIPFEHYQGQYLFDNQSSEENHPIWGESNPPPWLWRAFDHFTEGKATAADTDAILAFAEHHSHKGWKDYQDEEDDYIGSSWRERTLNRRNFRNADSELESK